MQELLVLLTGITLAVMVSINGRLSAAAGVLLATVIIHIVGSAFAGVLCALQKHKTPLWRRGPAWIYLGGPIGVIVTVFNNYACGRISMTSIIALGLLGQMVTALVLDGFGLLGMAKRPLRKSALPGLALSLAGVWMMLDASVAAAAVAVGISLAAGVCVVLSRTVNARLAGEIGALRGAFVNHLLGLPITAALALAFRQSTAGVPGRLAQQPWVLLGGFLGVAVVLLCNLTVPRVPAFRLTMLTFVGQVFTGILIDLLTGSGFSDVTFRGGAVIAAGVLLSLWAEHAAEKKTAARAQAAGADGQQSPQMPAPQPAPSAPAESAPRR